MGIRQADEPPARPVGHEQLQGKLDTAVLHFDLQAEVQHLQRQPAWSGGTGPSSTTLVKHPDLRVVLVAIRRGERLPEHRTAARITVHCLNGHIRLLLPAGTQDLPAGHVLMLDRELRHDVEALEDSAFLLTLCWPKEEHCPSSD
ncbi:MAG: cupin domain-containing protein [Terriglobales bacterium]